jgi:hypothetical protein
VCYEGGPDNGGITTQTNQARIDWDNDPRIEGTITGYITVEKRAEDVEEEY